MNLCSHIVLWKPHDALITHIERTQLGQECVPTVPLTPSASLNGICNRQ